MKVYSFGYARSLLIVNVSVFNMISSFYFISVFLLATFSRAIFFVNTYISYAYVFSLYIYVYFIVA